MWEHPGGTTAVSSPIAQAVGLCAGQSSNMVNNWINGGKFARIFETNVNLFNALRG
jgi:hypothetical protein